MTTQAVQQDPLTEDVDSFLKHYGVKGQKWGVTRNKPSSGQIMDARARMGSKSRQINRQIDKTNLAKPGKDQAAAAKKLDQMTMDFLKDPDRATAQRMTSGEKFFMTALAVGIPGPGTAAAGVGLAANTAKRVAIGRQQKKLGVKRY